MLTKTFLLVLLSCLLYFFIAIDSTEASTQCDLVCVVYAYCIVTKSPDKCNNPESCKCNLKVNVESILNREYLTLPSRYPIAFSSQDDYDEE